MFSIRIFKEQKSLCKFWTSFTLITFGSIAIGSHLHAVSQTTPKIPSLDEASQLAEQLTPEELAQIEIDDGIRDRLRFDLTWRPILEEARQDIMKLKWIYINESGHTIQTNLRDINLQNAIWKEYGSKVYPLLEYYTRSRDPIRQQYGMMGIRSLGKPFTTLWLTKHLKLKRTHLAFDLSKEILEQEFGLNEPETRESLVALAKQYFDSFQSYNTKPSDYYKQFNYQFLWNLGESERDFIRQEISFESDMAGVSIKELEANPESIASLQEWFQFEKLTSANESVLQSIVSYYQSLPRNIKDYILLRRLGPIKAGEISQSEKAFLKKLSTQLSSPDRTWVIAELNRHGNPESSVLLRDIIDNDLSQLHNLTTLNDSEGNIRFRVNGDRFYASSMGGHALYLLLGIAKQHPDSHFIQGCIEYANLRGMENGAQSYFGFDYENRRIDKTLVSQPVQNWQQWLTRYPDHPGADDAIYFVAKKLQSDNNILGAMNQWLKLMVEQPGDKDALELAWPYVRSLLDVGLSIDQLEHLIESQRGSDILPLLKYSLTVQYARRHDYEKALQISEQLDLTTMPYHVLGSYYNSEVVTTGPWEVSKIQNSMQSTLLEQRQRWQRLAILSKSDTPENKYLIASDWASSEGWKNGYLPIWDNYRSWWLPRLSPITCQEFWICDLNSRTPNVIVSSYHQASQNAVALSLYQNLIGDPKAPPHLVEKTLYMYASTLLAQWELHPIEETISIHPPSGVEGKSQLQKIWKDSQPIPGPYNKYKSPPNYREYEQGFWKRFSEAEDSSYEEIKQDYKKRIDEIIVELKNKFPESRYIDDLMFSSYFLNNDFSYLRNIVEFYPDGDRVAEASFLLNQTSSSYK